uniref:Geminin coiled-coil domain containing n=1 Tax=Pundamilia nyererei TaxID=303518 RepID=A0A3B4FMJ9_9CICH
MLQALALGPDTVDCSMETLASVWVHDPVDLSDLGEQRDESSPEWVFQSSLLYQSKMSFALSNLACFDSFCGDQRAPPQQISKRVCRNLTAQFCSESLETSACSEPNLDLWVLRTLGLKDRDTIDTSEESSSEWSLRSLTPSQDTIQFNPPAERVFPTPVLPSGADQPRSSASGFIPTSPCHPPAAPHTPRNRTDLAFSMSLSPSSSVKTHSFPQGQAFVRKDVEGRWNFTWVPRQEP